jgi:hypothetical protein
MLRLKGGLAAEISQALPGAIMTPGRALGGCADLKDELALSFAGQGKATQSELAAQALVFATRTVPARSP